MNMVVNTYQDSQYTAQTFAARFATIRNEHYEPFDVLIEDLSRDSFSMSTAANFSIGTILSLRLSGTLKREVRIVRRLGLVYRCEFLVPLDGSDIASALQG